MKRELNNTAEVQINLPTIDFSAISTQDFSLFLKMGMCYVKIPDELNHTTFSQVRDTVLSFHRQNEQEKRKHPFHDSNDNTGYINHTETSNQKMQQCIFKPNKPNPYFHDTEQAIDSMYSYITDKVIFPLLSQILSHLDVAEKDEKFNLLTTGLDSRIVSNYYPLLENSTHRYGFKPHKDVSLLGVLNTDAVAGLEIYSNECWQSVKHKPGYNIVVIGEALQLISSERCIAPLHRVTSPKEERLSIGVFYEPNQNAPLLDLISNKVLYERASDFFQQRLKYFFPVNQPEENSPLTLGKLEHKFSSPLHTKPDSNSANQTLEVNSTPDLT